MIAWIESVAPNRHGMHHRQFAYSSNLSKFQYWLIFYIYLIILSFIACYLFRFAHTIICHISRFGYWEKKRIENEILRLKSQKSCQQRQVSLVHLQTQWKYWGENWENLSKRVQQALSSFEQLFRIDSNAMYKNQLRTGHLAKLRSVQMSWANFGPQSHILFIQCTETVWCVFVCLLNQYVSAEIV